MPRFGMLIDLRTCIGCHACSVACKAEFDVPLGVFRDSVKYIETGRYPETQRHFVPVLCNHCDDAPCLKACPTAAISRLEDGQVVIDGDRCNAVRACMSACPYGAIYIDPFERIAQKCTLCAHRTSREQAPACVEACPTKCRVFGDLDDANSEIARKLAENPTVTWKPSEQTKPKVFYIDPRGALEHMDDQGVQMDREAKYTGEDAK